MDIGLSSKESTTLVSVLYPFPVNLSDPSLDEWLDVHSTDPVSQTAPGPNQHTLTEHIADDAQMVIARG